MDRRSEAKSFGAWAGKWQAKWPGGDFFEWARAEACLSTLEEIFEYEDQRGPNLATLEHFLKGLLTATKAIDRRKKAAERGKEVTAKTVYLER
jgi:hypothetical protein